MCQSDPPTGKPEQPNKTLLKEMHNAVEKRRRDKINTTIQELKDLIPSCRNVANNKAAILTQASEHIRHMSVANSNLMEANRRLQACLLPSLSLSLCYPTLLHLPLQSHLTSLLHSGIESTPASRINRTAPPPVGTTARRHWQPPTTNALCVIGYIPTAHACSNSSSSCARAAAATTAATPSSRLAQHPFSPSRHFVPKLYFPVTSHAR
jgi:hypothetical protein